MKGDLHIADLGYFLLKDFKNIDKKEAYYLSRLKYGLLIFWQKDDEKAFDLRDYLAKQNKNIIDFEEIYIGSNDRLKSRLIAYRLPEEVRKNRVRRKKLEYKRRY